MKILYLVYDEFAAAVFASQVMEPARRVALAGHDVFLAAMLSPRQYFRQTPELRHCKRKCQEIFKQSFFRLHLPHKLGYAFSHFQLSGIIDKCQPEIIHARGPVAAAVAIFARVYRRQVKVIFDCRGVWAEEFRLSGGYKQPPLTGKRLERQVAACEKIEGIAVRGADGFIAVTPQLADFYAKAYKRDLSKAVIIPCCAKVESFHFALEKRIQVRKTLGVGKEILWVYSGSAAAWQEPDAILSVMSFLQNLPQKQKFLLLTHDVELFKDLCRKYDISSAQVMVRSVKNEEVPDFLSAADAAFLLRSPGIVNVVASPVKCAEYLCLGLPVLISEGVGQYSKMIAKRGWGGVAADLSLANNAAQELLQSLPISEAERMQRGREAAAMLGWESHINTLLNCYADINDLKSLGVAHINHAFPVTTQTFTCREVSGLKKEGVDVRVFSLQPASGVVSEEAGELQLSTRYLPYVLSSVSLAANCKWFVLRPGHYFIWLYKCLTGSYQQQHGLLQIGQSLMQFLRAPLLAEAIIAEPGISHIHAQFADGAATTALFAAKLLNADFSFYSHTSYNSQLLPEKLAAASRVASISGYDKERLVRICPAAEGKIKIIHCGIPLAEWPRRDNPCEPGLIVSVGSLIEKKGHQYLLAACHLLKKNKVRFVCKIVGDGPLLGSLLKQREELSLEEEVEFLGALPPERIKPLLYKANLFVLACVQAKNMDIDGIPVSLMEAMAAGVPVVSTAVSGIPELIENGKSGLLVLPADSNLLAEATGKILTNSQFAGELVKHAGLSIRSHYTVRKQCKLLCAFFNLSEKDVGKAV